MGNAPIEWGTQVNVSPDMRDRKLYRVPFHTVITGYALKESTSYYAASQSVENMDAKRLMKCSAITSIETTTDEYYPDDEIVED